MEERDLQHWVDMTRRGGARNRNERFPDNQRFLRRGVELLDDLRGQAELPQPRLLPASHSPFPGVDCAVISRPASQRRKTQAFAPDPIDRQAPRLVTAGVTVAAVLFVGVLTMLFSGSSDSQPVAKRPLADPPRPAIEQPVGETLATSGGAEID